MIDTNGPITITPTHSCKNTAAELPFLYEDHERFAAFPTFPLVLPFKGTSHDVVPFPSPTLFSFPPGLPVVNPAMTLHAEQSIRILAPLPTDGATLTTRSKILVRALTHAQHRYMHTPTHDTN